MKNTFLFSKKEQNRRILAFMLIAGLSTLMSFGIVTPVFAADTGAALVTSSFSTLISIVTALVSSIGSIVLLWGFFEWGTAMQSQEGVMQANAFKRIGGGLVMVIAPQLVAAFTATP